MDAAKFFASPPRAERAFLSAYKSELLSGRFGIRIETEPLSFTDPDFDRELEPELILEYLALPSVDPIKLKNTRFSPRPDTRPSYEGSFYFLGEHNWVDLKEIRFLDAAGNSILAEYDLVIHLPKPPPNECGITLQAQTEFKTGATQLNPPRVVEGIGTLTQPEEDFWTGQAVYHGQSVEVKLSANDDSFEQIADYSRSVIAEQSLPRSKMDKEIADGLEMLSDKFVEFKVSSDFRAEDFVPRSFYFYKRRHHDSPEMIIVLNHPSDAGHWSLTFYSIDSGDLNWVPK